MQEALRETLAGNGESEPASSGTPQATQPHSRPVDLRHEHVHIYFTD